MASTSRSSKSASVCGTQTENGSCQRLTTSDQCFMHDGSELHPNHGAPEGNGHANGNKGGSPPIRNTNAMKHGVYASRSTLRAGMSSDEKQWLEEVNATVAQRIAMNERDTENFKAKRQAAGEDIAWLLYRRSLADRDLAERGLKLEGGKMNPSSRISRLLSSRVIDLLYKHAVKDPDQ